MSDMLDFETQQRVAAAAERSALAVERAARKVEDLAEYLRDRVGLCGHGFIYSTCGQCCATWMKSS